MPTLLIKYVEGQCCNMGPKTMLASLEVGLRSKIRRGGTTESQGSTWERGQTHTEEIGENECTNFSALQE
jgi:hypothetical protein